MKHFISKMFPVTSMRLVFWFSLLVSPLLWSAPDGELLYKENCNVCHQTKGKGGIGLPLTEEKLSSVSDDYLLKTIRLGRPGRIMPSFNYLSDAQVNALVAYLRSWTTGKAPVFSAERIEGDVRQGGILFGKHCSKCHGLDGSGEGIGTGVTMSRKRSFLVMPPAITNPGFLQSTTDEMIEYTILSGRDDTEMPSFRGKLKAEEIQNIIAFIRTQEGPPLRVANDDTRQTMAPSRVIESPYDMETTLENLRQALTGSNFRLFPERLLEEGLIDEFDVNRKQRTLRFCNFNALYAMLKIEPRLGVVLPCRITVVERDDKSVILVVPNFNAIPIWFNNNELFQLSSSMEENLLEIIEEATL